MVETSIERVFLHRDVVNHERVRSILARLQEDVPVEVVAGTHQMVQAARSLKDPLGQGKRMLFLSPHKGRMVGRCPGTPGHICCGYQILDVMSGCPMDCSYCILQGYLTNPIITIFTNLSDLFDELDRPSTREGTSPLLRVGPGELADSLGLDHLTLFSEELVAWFADQKDKILELKTKSDQVDHLLNLRHDGHTVVSWSLNPQPIIDGEEHRTPSLVQRLQAARKCQEAGYPIGLHFDPMIYEGSWESVYKGMVDRIFESVDPRGVIWISMGGLRFPPVLRPIIEDRFPESRVLLGELFPGRDGKLRYLETIRVKMYKMMRSWVHEIDSNLFVYLCMETPTVWEAVFGWSPENTAGLARIFDHRCREFMKQG
jgi:spore photoproduct lyase